MINLSLLNKALTDKNVSNAAFRLLYLIANNISMAKSETKEIYNGYLMDKLNLSERQIQRITKSLTDNGYINKKTLGTQSNKNGNLYSLMVSSEDAYSHCDTSSDIISDKDCDKKDTLYIDIKENKNILVNKTIDKDTNTNLRQSEEVDDIPFDIDEAKTETISEVKGTEGDKPIYVNSTDSENMRYTDEELRAVNQQAVEEWQLIDEARQQHIGNNHKEVNEWVGKKLSRGYDLLGTFRHTKKQDAANAYAHEINELIGSMNRAIQTGGITHNQAEAFGKFIDATNKAYDDKLRYFNRGEQIKKSKPQTALETEKTIIQQRGEETEKAAPRPTALTDADIQRMAKEANILFAMWDFQRLTELEEENKKTIEANGTPQQMNLYKRLTA